MRVLLFAILSSAIIFTSCANDAGSKTDSTGTTTASVESKVIAESNGIKLASFSESPNYDNARIDQVSYEGGKFSYLIPEGEYKLGEQTSDAGLKMCANSGEGQHIHLIIDDEPYGAYYTAEFNKDIEDGTHHILTFLSRSYHESIKTPEARRAFVVEVESNNFKEVEPIRDPMLFYSRPKGAYIGDETENVMLDFYPLNAPMGEGGYSVKVDVNESASFTVGDWKPFFLQGLPMGENKITLTLLDSDGNVVDAPLNPVSQTITLKADPANN